MHKSPRHGGISSKPRRNKTGNTGTQTTNTKKKNRPEDKELNEQKLVTHNTIMETDNKEENKLEFSTYKTVLKRLTLKNKKMYKHMNSSQVKIKH